eukprot:3290906-Rhodomonas_salina.3
MQEQGASAAGGGRPSCPSCTAHRPRTSAPRSAAAAPRVSDAHARWSRSTRRRARRPRRCSPWQRGRARHASSLFLRHPPSPRPPGQAPVPAGPVRQRQDMLTGEGETSGIERERKTPVLAVACSPWLQPPFRSEPPGLLSSRFAPSAKSRGNAAR